MEIFIGIIVLLAIVIAVFNRKPKELVEAEQAEVAPYKVETPVAQEATQAMVESIPAPAAAKKPRKPRAPKADAPAVKKPRKPRTPKKTK